MFQPRRLRRMLPARSAVSSVIRPPKLFLRSVMVGSKGPFLLATEERHSNHAQATPATSAVPAKQLSDLDELYHMLIHPASCRMQTIRERRDVLAGVDANIFSFSNDFPAKPHARRTCALTGQHKEALTAPAHFRDVDLPITASLTALPDAWSGDVAAGERGVRMAQADGVPIKAPQFTSLIGAHRGKGNPSSTGYDVLEIARGSGVPEDPPLHTTLVCWHLESHLAVEGFYAFEHMEQSGISPDAVAYTALMVACARGDRLEEATKLLAEMCGRGVTPTLATHNAYISVCARRVQHLMNLGPERRLRLRKLKVHLGIGHPVSLAYRQLEVLQAGGHVPDHYTFLSLLRVAAAAADVGHAQRLLSRMLDSVAPPTSHHFHAMLRSCIRSNRLLGYRDPAQCTVKMVATLRVASSALPSMQALGIPVEPMTTDLLLQAHSCVPRNDLALLEGNLELVSGTAPRLGHAL